MHFKTISILGCGWLGLPLAESLIKRHYLVKGSTTNPSKLDILREKGVEPYLLKLDPQLRTNESHSFFEADVLVLTIPFKRDLKDPLFYLKQVQSVISLLESSSIRLVLFTSSTSIYPDEIGLVDERVPFKPEGSRSKVLYQIERLLLANKHFQTTILRLGGLYGGSRAIGKFLSGKVGLADGSKPVNLVHRDDVVAIMAEIIEKNINSEVFNVCSDMHPTRKELYTAAALDQGLVPPTFKVEESQNWKIVKNDKLKNKLNYKFLFPDPQTNPGLK